MSTIPQQAGAAPAQSTFVTVVAWVWIILSAMGTAISALQSIMVSVFFFGEHGVMAQPPQDPIGAALAPLMPFFFYAFFALSALTLAASINLLRRRNWARLLFIGLLGFAIAWQFGGLVLQYWAIDAMQQTMPDVGAPNDQMVQMQRVLRVFQVVVAIVALAISGLFAWIIKRLVSPAIRAEFQPG